MLASFLRLGALIVGAHLVAYLTFAGMIKALDPDTKIPGLIGRALF